jgi:hypothetical protein
MLPDRLTNAEVRSLQAGGGTAVATGSTLAGWTSAWRHQDVLRTLVGALDGRQSACVVASLRLSVKNLVVSRTAKPTGGRSVRCEIHHDAGRDLLGAGHRDGSKADIGGVDLGVVFRLRGPCFRTVTSAVVSSGDGPAVHIARLCPIIRGRLPAT